MNTTKLIERLAEYNSATQDLIDACHSYEQFIKRQVPFEHWSNFGLKAFGSDPEVWTLSIFGEVLPARVEHFGLSLKSKGQDQQYCTADDLIKWTQDLPKKLELVDQKLTQLASDARAAFRLT